MPAKSRLVKKRTTTRAPARRRKRRVINWPPIIVLLIGINIAIGCRYSNLTSVRKLNVVGARASERLRLAGVVKNIENKPALEVNPHQVEGKFLAQTRIKTADFRRNIFGGASLKLEYRSPVYQVGNKPGIYLDSEGVIFGDPEVKKDIPRLKLDSGMQVSVVGITGVIDFAQLAQFGELVTKTFANSNTKPSSIVIKVEDTGALCLNMQNCLVKLGSFDDLDRKIQTLKRLIGDRPTLFEESKEINLFAYDKPSQLPRQTEPETKPESEPKKLK
jgi:hypothetical protein